MTDDELDAAYLKTPSGLRYLATCVAVMNGGKPSKEYMPEYWASPEAYWDTFRGWPDDAAEEVDVLASLLAGMTDILHHRSEDKPWTCTFNGAYWALYWSNAQIHDWIRLAVYQIQERMYPIRFGHQVICKPYERRSLAELQDLGLEPR